MPAARFRTPIESTSTAEDSTITMPNLPETYQHRLMYCDSLASYSKLYGIALGAAVIYACSGLIDSPLVLSIAVVLIVAAAYFVSCAYFLRQGLVLEINKLIDSGAIAPNDLFNPTIYPKNRYGIVFLHLALNAIVLLAIVILQSHLAPVIHEAIDVTYNEVRTLAMLAVGFFIGTAIKYQKQIKGRRYSYAYPQLLFHLQWYDKDPDSCTSRKRVRLMISNGVSVSTDAEDFHQEVKSTFAEADDKAASHSELLSQNPQLMESYHDMMQRLLDTLQESRNGGELNRLRQDDYEDAERFPSESAE